MAAVEVDQARPAINPHGELYESVAKALSQSPYDHLRPHYRPENISSTATVPCHDRAEQPTLLSQSAHISPAAEVVHSFKVQSDRTHQQSNLAENPCCNTERHPLYPAHDINKSHVKDTLCGQLASGWNRILRAVTCGWKVLWCHSEKEDSGSINAMRWQGVSTDGCKVIDRPVRGELKRCSEVDLGARQEKVVECFREKMNMS